MATPYFKFKQFTVWHNKCAMKVGTDGVLLGALAPLDSATAVLDVGTGTGLIALMLAQRARQAAINTHITALELDTDAALQATENVVRSPWPNDITVLESDYKTFESTTKFDLIVSNPPYFVNALKSPSANRTQARHTDTLSFEDLIGKSRELLTEDGILGVIIPTDATNRFQAICADESLHLIRKVTIITTPGAKSKRIVLFFSPKPRNLKEEMLLIELERHKYSEDYINLTKEFYLKM